MYMYISQNTCDFKTSTTSTCTDGYTCTCTCTYYTNIHGYTCTCTYHTNIHVHIYTHIIHILYILLDTTYTCTCISM